MTQTHPGGGLCTASRFPVDSAPKVAIRCLCRDCPHVSLGGHPPRLAVERAALGRPGPIGTHQDTAASSRRLGFQFCETCGSPQPKTTTRARDLGLACPGALDEPSLRDPGRTVFKDSRQLWDTRSAPPQNARR